ncbi:MAG TPA: ABC transporter permease, partial [Gammaproteobacteria bacterium]|nr:ABC transporter permease [Gammaproteobacteria bacterium]
RSVDNFTAWADATDLHQTFTHGEPYESVRVRLRASDQLAAFQTYLDKHPQIKAHAERLITYQEISSRNFRNLIILIGVIVEVLLLIAACLGSFYALRALIEARTREVGLFRSLGFKRSSVFGGLLIETIVIVLIGAFVAVAVVAVTFTGQSFYTYNIGGSGTFLLQPRLTPAIVGAAAVAALLLGLIGGIGPAWRAGRLSVAEVLRKA